MFFRKKKHASQPKPPWFKWVALGFLAVAIAGGLQKKPGGDTKIHEALETARVNLSQKSINLDEYRKKIFPSYQAALRMRDVEPGEGMPAVCGQQVSLAYDAWLDDDKQSGDRATHDQPLKFRIGEGKVIPALEQGVVGMKKGGKRSIFAPAAMAYSKDHTQSDAPQNAETRFEIELLDVTPPLPAPNDTSYRITLVRGGTGKPALCGEQVKAHVTLWSVDGNKLFTTHSKNDEPVSFTTGDSEVFLGLEQGVLGMQKGEERMLIVPPAFQKTMNGNAPAIVFPFPKNQTVLVDVEALP